jgi:AraC-like DNA-binding protein
VGRLASFTTRSARAIAELSPARHRLPQSPTAQLLGSAHEDIARLTDILSGLRCIAVVRGIDGVVSPLNEAAASIDGYGTADAPALSAPIYDAQGRPLAALEVIPGEMDRSDSSDRLLRALIESAARAITERWFRLQHRRQWIVAAMRRNAAATSMVIAVDHDQRLVGADRKARELLDARGWRFDQNPGLAALFQSSPHLFRRRSGRDISTTLLASGDCEPWIGIITPPDIGASEPYHDGRAALHARPRLDLLTHSGAAPSQARRQRGLSHIALKRIEEYVDAHLDSALDIDELAALVRMSSSHFTRSFQKSVGLTPHKYVIQYRVMKARELLATTDLPLTQIALTMGFSDQSHFSRRFHELVGLPPGAFRGHEGQSVPTR